MVRTKQGGSILGFIIIGVTLVALLLAGVWAVRHYDFGAAQNGDDVAIHERADDSEPAPAPAEDGAKESEKSESGAGAPAPTQQRETPRSETNDDKPVSDGGDGSTSDETATPRERGSSDVAELPQTGASEWLNGIAFGALVGAAAAYMSSRRVLS